MSSGAGGSGCREKVARLDRFPKEDRAPGTWYKGGVTAGRLRAAWRLGTFVVGSWWVVARAWQVIHRPYPERWRLSGPAVSAWARLGCRRLGIRVARVGPAPPAGSLVVANHLGYIDILTLGGLVDGVFAARHDMRTWPVMGRLADAGAAVFINRESSRAGVHGVKRVAAALQAGATVIAFPEGTSRGGGDVLPFRTGLFEAALAAGAPVVPVGIRYTALDDHPVGGAELEVIGWFGNEPFLLHILTLAGHRSIAAEARFGEPIPPPHAGRRELAAAAEARVRGLLIPPACDAGAAGLRA